jgi:hypothetical protein
MKKKTLIYLGVGLIAFYLIRISYKTYKVNENVSDPQLKEALITQVLILNNEKDTKENREKYSSLSTRKLEKMINRKSKIGGPTNPKDTTGAGSWQ